MNSHSWWALVVFLGLCGCGAKGAEQEKPIADSSVPAASAMSIRVRTSGDPSSSVPQKSLEANEVRVSLLVLPGDALVEVDKVPVRRRNGMVELVGNVGDERVVQVFVGATAMIEKTVTIEATGTSPPLIDASEANTANAGPAKSPAVFDINE